MFNSMIKLYLTENETEINEVLENSSHLSRTEQVKLERAAVVQKGRVSKGKLNKIGRKSNSTLSRVVTKSELELLNKVV